VSAYIETQTLDEDGNVIDESRRFLRHEDEPFDAGDPLVLEVISDSDEQDQDGSWCRCQRLRMRTESAEELERAICAGMAAGGDELDWDAPEFSAAREASKAATWDFDGWRPVRNALLRGYVILGDTVFA
jgi:hypothetical protein